VHVVFVRKSRTWQLLVANFDDGSGHVSRATVLHTDVFCNFVYEQKLHHFYNCQVDVLLSLSLSLLLSLLFPLLLRSPGIGAAVVIGAYGRHICFFFSCSSRSSFSSCLASSSSGLAPLRGQASAA